MVFFNKIWLCYDMNIMPSHSQFSVRFMNVWLCRGKGGYLNLYSFPIKFNLLSDSLLNRKYQKEKNAAMVSTVWCIWQHVGWHAEAHVLTVFLCLWFVLLPLPWCSLVKKLPHYTRTVLVSFTSHDVNRHSSTRFEFECEIQQRRGKEWSRERGEPGDNLWEWGHFETQTGWSLAA